MPATRHRWARWVRSHCHTPETWRSVAARCTSRQGWPGFTTCALRGRQPAAERHQQAGRCCIHLVLACRDASLEGVLERAWTADRMDGKHPDQAPRVAVAVFGEVGVP